ncbi:hypothetical protein [Roseobacter sp. A03A-229]
MDDIFISPVAAASSGPRLNPAQGCGVHADASESLRQIFDRNAQN